jgi:hypothetical protein
MIRPKIIVVKTEMRGDRHPTFEADACLHRPHRRGEARPKAICGYGEHPTSAARARWDAIRNLADKIFDEERNG